MTKITLLSLEKKAEKVNFKYDFNQITGIKTINKNDNTEKINFSFPEKFFEKHYTFSVEFEDGSYCCQKILGSLLNFQEVNNGSIEVRWRDSNDWDEYCIINSIGLKTIEIEGDGTYENNILISWANRDATDVVIRDSTIGIKKKCIL